LIVAALTEVLVEMDPINAYFFNENAAALIAELEDLDRAFTEVVENASRNIVVFGDRFAFHYLMASYGITAYAAFPGCSPATQASPATIAAIIEMVREQEIPVVFYTEMSTRHIALAIAGETDVELVEMHSAHNVTSAEFDAGVTFVEIMWRNVEALRSALG